MSGSQPGVFIGYGEVNLYGLDKSLNFQIDFNTTKALRRGIGVNIGGKSIWIDFRYERLPDFYYA